VADCFVFVLSSLQIDLNETWDRLQQTKQKVKHCSFVYAFLHPFNLLDVGVVLYICCNMYYCMSSVKTFASKLFVLNQGGQPANESLPVKWPLKQCLCVHV